MIKHTNPCGAAIGDSAADAYVRARDADSLAAFGGIVALNRPIDAAAAQAIVSTFIEAVIAPAVDAAARDDPGEEDQHARRDGRLRRRCGHGGVELRSILGAMLVQERDASSRRASRWTPASLPDGLRVVDQAAADRARSGRRCASPGASART